MLEIILKEIKQCQSDQIKKIYLNHGIKEPVWGVRTGDLKKIIKKYKILNNHQLAIELYDTNIYEAMYLAGLIEDEKQMTFEQSIVWLKKANSYPVGEYIIASVVSETEFAKQFIEYCLESNDELIKACGYSTLTLYIGLKKVEIIDFNYLKQHLLYIKDNIFISDDRVKSNMNSFIYSVAISRPELTDFAFEIAQQIGNIEIKSRNKNCQLPNAVEQINKAKDKNRIGFRRKTSRCY